MAETRDRIITATNELFRRHGYNGTTLKQVSTAADAPIGSIYHFFPGGKDELAEAVIQTSGAIYQQLFEMIADGADGLAAATTDFFEGAADVLEESGYIDICPIGTVAREVASTNEMLREATHRVFAGWIDAAASRLTAAGIPHDEAEELATTIVAALEGGFMLARAARNPAPLRATGRQIRRLVDSAFAASPVT